MRASTTPRARRQAGTPAGGQFAPSGRAEADVSLTDAATEGCVSDDGLDDKALMEQARASASFFARRLNIYSDTDDVMQDALVSYLSARRKAAEEGVHPDAQDSGNSFPTAPEAQRGYLHTVVSNSARKTRRRLWYGDQIHSSTAAALRKLNDQVAAEEQRLGRQVTGRERDAMAERIRAEMPDGSRAPVGFQNQHHRPVSTDELTESDQVRMHQWSEPMDYSHADDEMTEPAEEVLNLMEAGGRANQAQARKMAWDAVASQTGAPGVKKNCFKPSEATKLRATAAGMGGAGALAARVRDGSDGPGEADVLFAPFGGSQAMTADEQERAVGMLTRNPAYSDTLWDSAVSAATIFRVR